MSALPMKRPTNLIRTVTTEAEIDIDLIEEVQGLDRYDLLKLRDVIDAQLNAMGDFPIPPGENALETLFLACRSGDRERAFDIAYDYSRNALGRVC